MNKITSKIFQLEQELTADQLQYFHEHGIIQFKNFIDRSTVLTLLKEIQ